MSTWISGTAGTWTDSGNWSGGVPNGLGADASFNFALNGASILVGIPDFSAITLTTLNVTLTGTANLVILGSLSDTGAGNGLLTFNGNGSNAQVTINNDETTGSFSISSVYGLLIDLATNTNFNVVNVGGRAILNAPISGGGTLFKTGAGMLTLNATNTFTGGFALQGGILQASGDDALGSGQIALANNAAFRSSGTIDNTFATNAANTGTPGSGQILAAAAATMTLSGVLDHVSQGTITFGSATDTGTITASFSAINENATNSSYQLFGGTLRLGDAFNAANLLNHPGAGLTRLASGGILDTNGFTTTISNLLLSSGSSIRSTTGVLNLTVKDVLVSSISVQAGTVEGTAGADSWVINTNFGFDLTSVSFVNWTAGIDTITMNGSASDNYLIGSIKRETINGFDGDDYIDGTNGGDVLNGGAGNDVIFASGIGASIDGGAGIDTLRQAGGSSLFASVSSIEAIELSLDAFMLFTGAQFATGIASNASLNGSGTIRIDMAPGDKVLASGMTVEAGSAIDFRINGSTGVDVIKANINATNIINGGDSTDQIRGGSRADVINGGTGNDKILGFGGADILTGGTGADKFRYIFGTDSGIGADADTITDFVSGSDQIDFRLLDPNPVLPGVQTFTFLGTLAFSADGSAQIRYTDLGADLRVQVDLDGNGTSDMEILLTGAGAGVLLPNDFLL